MSGPYFTWEEMERSVKEVQKLKVENMRLEGRVERAEADLSRFADAALAALVALVMDEDPADFDPVIEGFNEALDLYEDRMTTQQCKCWLVVKPQDGEE